MAICRWTDEETDDHVLGSGASMWEWYATHIGTDADGYVVTMTEPDTDGPQEYRFTRGKVRDTVTAIMMGQYDIGKTYVDYLKNDDPDAAVMDCVIQICAYGEVVYG